MPFEIYLSPLLYSEYKNIQFLLCWVGGVSVGPGANRFYAEFQSIGLREDFIITD